MHEIRDLMQGFTISQVIIIIMGLFYLSIRYYAVLKEIYECISVL